MGSCILIPLERTSDVPPSSTAHRGIQAIVRATLVFGILGGSLALNGCAAYTRGNTEQEGTQIQRQKTDAVEQFRRDGLIDPRVEGAPPPTDEELLADLELPDPMLLDDAIRIATERNREYKAQRESLFLSALDLGVTRRDFLRPVFDGSIGWEFTDGSSLSYSDVTSLSIGGSYLLFNGGRINLSSALSVDNAGNGPGKDQSSSGSTTISLNQPLLQGAGHDIAFEGLTQAERNLLYDARSFELFRQDFVIGIIDDYYALLSQKQQLVDPFDDRPTERVAPSRRTSPARAASTNMWTAPSHCNSRGA